MSTKYKFIDPKGIYFVSFATVGWVDVFTRPEYKEIFIESVQYCQTNKGLILHAWCLMTNHVHLIFSTRENTLHSDILRDFKKYTSKKILEAIQLNKQESRKEWMLSLFNEAGKMNNNNKEFQFWQQDKHPIEVHSPMVIAQKIEYIHNNPVETGIVSEPEHYMFSSARDYIGLKGLIQVDVIDIPSTFVGYVHLGG